MKGCAALLFNYLLSACGRN